MVGAKSRFHFIDLALGLLVKNRDYTNDQTRELTKPHGLPKYSDPSNLVPFPHLPHTRLTYHRTWETGLEPEIRVADFSPAFFCLEPDSP
jgi:hypothetical protein